MVFELFSRRKRYATLQNRFLLINRLTGGATNLYAVLLKLLPNKFSLNPIHINAIFLSIRKSLKPNLNNTYTILSVRKRARVSHAFWAHVSHLSACIHCNDIWHEQTFNSFWPHIQTYVYLKTIPHLTYGVPLVINTIFIFVSFLLLWPFYLILDFL